MRRVGADITMLPEMSRRHFRHAGVGPVDFAAPRPARLLGLVRVKDRSVGPATRAFTEFIRKATGAASEKPAILNGGADGLGPAGRRKARAQGVACAR